MGHGRPRPNPFVSGYYNKERVPQVYEQYGNGTIAVAIGLANLLESGHTGSLFP